MRIIIAVICVIAFVLGVLAFRVGAYFNLVMMLIMAGCVIIPFARLPYIIKNEIFWRFWKTPFARDNLRYWRQILLRLVFWGLCAVTVYTGIVRAQFTAEELQGIYVMIGGGAAFLAIISLIPKRVGAKPMSIFAAISIPIMAFILGDSLYPQLSGKGAITAQAPFDQPSYMFHAGHNTMVNYHVAHSSQQHALDIVLTYPNGQSRDGDAKDLESYACFGAPLIAPVAGRIERVVTDKPDQAIGTSDPKSPAGNHVVIRMDDTHYALLAHMKEKSAIVKEGDLVAVGDKLGECGNSGNTSEPHLHFQIQRYPDLFAKGGYTYPVNFDGTTRVRGGKKLSQDGLFYRRNDMMIPN